MIRWSWKRGRPFEQVCPYVARNGRKRTLTHSLTLFLSCFFHAFKFSSSRRTNERSERVRRTNTPRTPHFVRTQGRARALALPLSPGPRPSLPPDSPDSDIEGTDERRDEGLPSACLVSAAQLAAAVRVRVRVRPWVGRSFLLWRLAPKWTEVPIRRSRLRTEKKERERERERERIRGRSRRELSNRVVSQAIPSAEREGPDCSVNIGQMAVMAVMALAVTQGAS